MEFNHALAVFQHLLSIDEDKMLENLTTCISPKHAFYPEVLTYIQAHYKNSQHTSFSDLISQQANTLVNDEAIHQLIDTQIGYYKLTKKLGQGGMGVVYLGERNDGQIEQKVAIKFVYPSIAMLAGDGFLQKEAQCLATIDHHYIVKIHTVDTTKDGLAYMVMEYIDGMPIDEYCKTHELSLTKTIKLFQKVCAAVQQAHNKFIIHADLKPSNIFVNSLGEPKLMDFGIARTLIENQKNGVKNQHAEHQQISAASRNFASPEQVNGDTLSTASDIYAAGKILQLLLKRCASKGGLQTKWYTQTVEQCTLEDPNSRIQSFDLLAQGLDNIAKNYPPQWVNLAWYHKYQTLLIRNKTLSTVVGVFMLVVFIFMFKLIQQNHMLLAQDDANKKVIAFLKNLFTQSPQSDENTSLFRLLKTTDINNIEPSQQALKPLEPQLSSPFSPFVFTNHSVKTHQPIQLQLTQSTVLKQGFNYQINGSGVINENGLYQASFDQVGIKTVTITATNGEEKFELLLNFIVRDDKKMPFTFADVAPEHDTYAEIHYLALKGILIGRPGQTPDERIFSPHKLVKQAEALKIILLAAHSRNIIRLKKSDNIYPNLVLINDKGGVEDFSWAAAFLDHTALTHAIEDLGSFDPKAPATKEWLARILVKTLKLLDPSEFAAEQDFQFLDKHQFTSTQGYDYSRITAFYNLLGKLGYEFSPKVRLTREDIALIAGKILQLPAVNWEDAGTVQDESAFMHDQPESFNIHNLPNLQTPGYQRVGNNIITLDPNDPSRARLEFKMIKDKKLIIVLSNAYNNVRNSFSIPLNSSQLDAL